MTEEKVFLIISAIPNPDNMEGFQLYLSKIMPIIMSNGGKIVGRYKTIEQLMGEGGPKVTAMVEFPSAETVKKMIAGDEFNALKELRAETFKKMDLMLSAAM